MRHIVRILLAVMVFISPLWGLTLREQLTSAEEDKDTHAQIEILRRILASDADDPLNRQLINLWISVADYDMASKALADWKNAPEGFRTATQAEVLYNKDSDQAGAIALLEAYHASHPDDLVITGQLARYFSALREHKKLVELLSNAPGASDDATLLLSRAAAKRATGDYAGALADFAEAEKIDAKAGESVRPSFERLKEILPRLQAANARLEKNPQDFAALVARAYWLRAVEANPDLVRAGAEAAYKRAPKSTAAILLQARASYGSSRALEELSVDLRKPDPSPESLLRLVRLDEIMEQNPQDAATLVARSAELNGSPAQYQLALKDADAALEFEPADAKARLEKMVSLLKLERLAEAEAESLLLKGAPSQDRVRATQLLGEACLSAGRLEPAVAYATKALESQPSRELYELRAAAFQRLGRAADARDDLAKAKKHKP